MTDGDRPGVPVAEAIEVLRSELEEALMLGAGRRVQFTVPEVTLTVSVVAGRTKEAGAKLRWWVVEAGGSGSWSQETTQSLMLTLRPQQVSPVGTRTDLTVGATDTEDAGSGPDAGC